MQKYLNFFIVNDHHLSPKLFLVTRVDPDHTEEIHPCDGDSVEYFFASDASAIIEHTNR